ncbi:MAG: type ISP restriction/modification enzyme [Bellilinea sp.]
MGLNLKPEHKVIKTYYAELENLTGFLNAKTEGAVAPLFAAVLRHCAGQMDRTLVEQYPLKRNGQNLRLDGAIVDSFNLAHGYWEAKDTDDDLSAEIKKKVEKGYPRDNTLFQAPRRAVLYQNSNLALDADISHPEKLIEILKLFFEYEPPIIDQWQKAAEEFKLKVPELGEGLLKLIEEQRKQNPVFVRAFEDFTRVVQESINPNISTQAVEEMLIQHILTERIFRKIFNNPDFTTRNVIAVEIEKVIRALTSHSFSRDQFLGSLDRFYGAIETTAATIGDYSEKQAFLNTVYEKFFQGFSVKAADIYGIVYTPQPVVNFMVNSVEHILKEEFGRSLSDENVHIIDPFVGTGNFIINIMRRIQKTKLPQKYANELHCNEVMLLPYYIASMNIEHAYMDLTGAYQPFEGICLVDTFEVTEQMSIFGHENTERIARQRNAPIFVVIANPPYNAGQVNENDNNKNRKYPILDKRVSDTYGKASKAQLVRKLNDPYIKAIRWATDRIGEEGIIAFVNNNSFITDLTFDGMRKHLAQDFDSLYILDLGGNVRKNLKLSGTTHNVFGIQVGVSINLLVKSNKTKNDQARIYYAHLGEMDRKEVKYDFLVSSGSIDGIRWEEIRPDDDSNWLNENIQRDFSKFLPLGSKEEKAAKRSKGNTIFKSFSLGVSTNRDVLVYDFNAPGLHRKINAYSEFYNNEIHRLQNKREKTNDIDNFVDYSKVKWSSTLKRHLKAGNKIVVFTREFRQALYRPYTKENLIYNHILVDRPGSFTKIFPDKEAEQENLSICLSTVGVNKPFHTLTSNYLVDLHFTGDTQCFPFYTYSEDGSNRTENITNWALKEYQTHYNDSSITKWAIFHYVYGYLHHPGYRSKYAANLRRELPRIPFAPDFWAFATAGKRLAEIHVHYEDQPEYPLVQVENPLKPLNWRVEKMKLSPDKTALIYNEFLTLTGIPAMVYDYKLGNRSALEWIVDQYRVKTDPRSGITNDPNNPDAPDAIIRLIKKIVTVSLETVEIVKGLPEEFK